MKEEEQFIKHITIEIENIKKYAAESEIGKLRITKLDPMSHHFSIYGQMTGNCQNDRAIKLINKCASKISSAMNTFWESKGAKTKDLNHSYLEVIMYLVPSNNPNIFRYLKGKDKELKLTTIH